MKASTSDPLKNDNRAAIFDAVKRFPGIHLAAVVERTDIASSTVRYHCRVLEEADLIKSETSRGRRQLFPLGIEREKLAAALADSSVADVLSAVRRLEPAKTTDIADELDRVPSTISHHLRRLRDEELVTRDRDECAVLTRLNPDVRDALEGRDIREHDDS